MNNMNKTKNFIPGYSGFVPSSEEHEDVLQINKAKSHIPGYNGYIEGSKSENLMGKTFGKITYQSSTKSHHIGTDLPPQLRYLSQCKDEYRPQKEVKVKDLDRLRTIEDAKKQAGQFYGNEVMGYSSFDKTTLPLMTGEYKERPPYQSEQLTDLTYEEARQQAYNAPQ
ncbi:hypothetical protein PPERSA_11039 [Pseudocohnilembus persalinus]|uniref:Uncharacterized protein n=1 Tax=Pseudocohnilembus persalinus TaxID=266149 RepID=A0A0V0QYZ7_PSEPJ|nr:hypothetical protein PPERSA_11039 [Pseudocohnilembus persalinus]|eukprot:KRX07490.1 hypothetical protein PPERSA_11039 [Pseudocohnilembus persalinus]